MHVTDAARKGGGCCRRLGGGPSPGNFSGESFGRLVSVSLARQVGERLQQLTGSNIRGCVVELVEKTDAGFVIAVVGIKTSKAVERLGPRVAGDARSEIDLPTCRPGVDFGFR